MIQPITLNSVGMPAHGLESIIIDFNAIIDYNSSWIEMKMGGMASITIRNLEDAVKQRLRVRAAEHGHSMEEEARNILRQVMAEATPPRDLAAAIRARVAPSARIDLDLPIREQIREPQRFGW